MHLYIILPLVEDFSGTSSHFLAEGTDDPFGSAKVKKWLRDLDSNQDK
ncbi:MAG TPA: hypothetical protein VJI70_03365 [Candidatus Paceibacterota bacterium]